MIICFIGTRAQLIKMAPIMLEIERRNAPFQLIMTGQHQDTMAQLLEEFGITTTPKYLYSGKEITGIIQMAGWFLGCLRKCLFTPQHWLQCGTNDKIILVHGDTMSTLLGTLVGKFKKIKIAHVEAGLRSHNLFHPFPEEITRLAVSRLAKIAFCPGQWAYENLANHSVERINTHLNTLVDALKLAIAASNVPAPPSNYSDFGLVSIHRFENIFDASRLAKIITLIEIAATKYPVKFVLHPATRKKISQFGLLQKLEHNPRIHLVPRMGYITFVGLLQQASFVITDGGGNQEELSYLGIPTLLMRKATERQEGLNSTATLGNYDENILRRFLETLPNQGYRFDAPAISPSSIIVNHLLGHS